MSERGVQRDAGLMAVLRRLDDPRWLEFPADYGSAALAASCRTLVADLDSRFATSCPIERDIQDSAQYGRIEVPGPATVCGTRIVVLVSKFTPLAMVAADNPGAFLGTDEACAEGELDAGDLEKVEQALVGSGHLVIPEELLMTRYDGVAHLRFCGSGGPYWWDRFFGSF
ncbi:hypothetical protein AB0B85_08535 [Micromonospora sp. NPDC049044]|uniref:hypothetical protein n=1 Tax=unclassified Micromonospora TaxID=2617518 RepID=UPI0033DBE562